MTISVIIPTYNRSKTIQRTLNSVFKQTVQDLEIIVVDDGSTDDTEAVLKELWGDKIRYVRQENQGASVARNLGASLATGEYFSFLDSDDEWTPDKLEKQLAMFQASKDPNLGVVLCGCRTLHPTYERTDILRHIALDGEAFEQMLELQPVIGRNIGALVHRRVFDSGINFDTNQIAIQDREFLLAAAKNFTFQTVPEPLLIAHVETGRSHIHSGDRIAKGWLQIMDKYESDLQARPVALARTHRLVAGAYNRTGDMKNIRYHLKLAQGIKPSFSDAVWLIAARANLAGFRFLYRGVRYVNRGLRKVHMPIVPTPFP